MSLLGTFDTDYLWMFFCFHFLLMTAPYVIQDILRQAPTRAACRWMIRQLLYVHVLITLTPQLLLTGVLVLTRYVEFRIAIFSMLVVVPSVMLAMASFVFYIRLSKILARKLPEDNPQEQEQISQLVSITTTFTFWYSAAASFLVFWYFIAPEIAWAMASQRWQEIWLLTLYATCIYGMLICVWPLHCRSTFEDYLRYAENNEHFERRREGFFGRRTR